MVGAAVSVVPEFIAPQVSHPAPVADWVTELAEPTILVVDDDPDMVDMVTTKLVAAGYRVITADNGASALRMVVTEQPDMLVLDISMPGLDGLSVCYELHSSADTAAIPVLMMSGHSRQVDIDLGMTVGADDYLVKPFNPAELVRRVRWLLMAN
ncbi:response regulator [Actinoplanes bogorensis]|uniref:Response regulator n=1 Tax=Paractinoplanes bogorensis TaxID=1610840 RepID=A0ABS5Z4A8_9ACTN|nr:response regulator [Actinoplanes bogorensis]MBU2669255.1 response regulator [Actinoplanes bogorensis]